MGVSLEVRMKLWAWNYARLAFQSCKVSCDYILKNKLDADNPLYHPLNIAAVVCYGRPFKKSRGIDTLPEDIVPADYKAQHKELLILRDKIYAHTDTTPFATEVLFRVHSSGMGQFMTLERNSNYDGLLKLSKLSGILIEKCVYHIDKLFAAHVKGFPNGDGMYRVTIQAAPP